jgi:hypothetical protein
MKDLTDYYSTVGYLRGQGLDETRAYHHAHELMEAPVGPNEWNMQNILTDALEAYADEEGKTFKIRSYEDAGLLTRNTGLIVEVEGSTFQLTIVKA